MDRQDNELVRGLRRGEEAAFQLLLARYLAPTYRFLVQLTHDPVHSEDLAQETFIKVWKHLGKFNEEKKFKTWIFAIAKNTAFDFLRKKKALPFSHFETEEGLNPLEQISDSEALPDELMNRHDLNEVLEKAFENLSDDQATVLRLHYKEGFSLMEIAEILGVPYNTLKSWHLRALTRLRAALTGTAAPLRKDAS